MTTRGVEPRTPARLEPLPTVADVSGRTLGQEELDALADVIRSGTLNRVGGAQVDALEREMAALYSVPEAIACSSGTAALHLAVAAVDPEPGDEIITTPISDAGSVIPILLQNAVPVFADVDPLTGNLDPAAVEAAISERTRAILVVHLFGQPARIDELAEIARRNGVVLIEDCAQAYLAGDERRGGFVGTRGDIGCFSLQQSKHVTCGDGGLCITSDRALAERMRLLADKAWPRDSHERVHLFLGFNYRMTELQGAVARVQLTKVGESVARRREAAARLADRIGQLGGLHLPDRSRGHAFWLMPLVLSPLRGARHRNRRFAEALGAEGVPSQPGYLERPLYANPVLREGRTYGRSRFPLTAPPARRDWTYPPGLCPRAEELIEDTLVALPWNERYSDGDVDDVAEAIRRAHASIGLGRG